jgi:hypothetical protein
MFKFMVCVGFSSCSYRFDKLTLYFVFLFITNGDVMSHHFYLKFVFLLNFNNDNRFVYTTHNQRVVNFIINFYYAVLVIVDVKLVSISSFLK